MPPASGSVAALLGVAGFADAHDYYERLEARKVTSAGTNVAQPQRSQRGQASSTGDEVLAAFVLPRPGYSVGRAMSCRLGCLVSARRSLYQSKPSIEALEATTAGGGRKHLVTSSWPRHAQWSGRTTVAVDVVPSAPTRTYLSHRANSLPTPRLDGRKRRNHGDFGHLGPARARTTDGGVGTFRANSAPGQQNACKSAPSGPASGRSRRGVRAT